MKLGKYELKEELGRGGFGVVYRTLDVVLEVERAVKVLHPVLLVDPSFIERFRREARTAAKLDHPHIVPVYDLDEDQGRYFLAMRYLSGGSLKELLATEGRLAWERALAITRQVAEGLAFAHDHGLVHRDLKPGNLLFEGDGSVRVADFGFARAMADAGSTLSSASGGMVGTPAYMAPELWSRKAVGAWTDVYALACVLYEMLSGEVLFAGETPPEVMLKHFGESPQFARGWDAGAPPGLEAVLVKALAKEPGERYVDMSAFLTALDGLVAVHKHGGEQEQRAQREAREREQEGIRERERLDASVSVRYARTSEQPAGTRRVPTGDGRRIPLWQPIVGGFLALIGVFVVMMLLTNWLSEGGLTKRTTLTTVSTQPITPDNSRFETMTPIEPEVPAASTTIAITPNPPLGIGSTMVSEKDGMVMVYVPEGEFQMGSDDRYDDEKPTHTVYLDAYWIDQSEVTNAMFAYFLSEMGNQIEGGVPWLNVRKSEVEITQSNGLWQPESGKEYYPVIEVSWYGARAFCEWVGRRLPSEAEWEKAARGTDERIYPWGNTFDCSKGNFDDETTLDDYVVMGGPSCDGYDRTSPVGIYPGDISPYGVLDMAGNVMEWVTDWYNANYYSNSYSSNPLGPSSGTNRVLRGGSWIDRESSIRTAYRSFEDPYRTHDYIGFRCALSQEPGE